jgi:hypothetical protein
VVGQLQDGLASERPAPDGFHRLPRGAFERRQDRVVVALLTVRPRHLEVHVSAFGRRRL